jgi:hypothetical protein
MEYEQIKVELPHPALRHQFATRSSTVWHSWLADTKVRTERGPVGLQRPSAENGENTDVVDTVISNVLRDLPISRNHPLKSAGD